jgi:hypothetical protein
MRILTLAATAVTLVACTTAVARDSKPSGEQARVERELAALTPGKPIECLDSRANGTQLIALDTKLVYRFSRDRAFVTETGGGCRNVARGDTLVTVSPFGRVCRGDIARTVSYPGAVMTGSCAIGPIIPYTRAK